MFDLAEQIFVYFGQRFCKKEDPINSVLRTCAFLNELVEMSVCDFVTFLSLIERDHLQV